MAYLEAFCAWYALSCEGESHRQEHRHRQSVPPSGHQILIWSLERCPLRWCLLGSSSPPLPPQSAASQQPQAWPACAGCVRRPLKTLTAALYLCNWWLLADLHLDDAELWALVEHNIISNHCTDVDSGSSGNDELLFSFYRQVAAWQARWAGLNISCNRHLSSSN